MNDAINMQVSAFVDGELPDNESELLLRRLSQDAELRQQAADFLAIGRAMRGQRGVPGMEHLRDRIAAAIDNNQEQADFDAIEPTDRRLVRPVAGFAIAATVALAAILGLQRMDATVVPEASPVAGIADAAPEDASYTVPDAYYQLHREASSNINAVLTDFRTREEDLEEAADEAVDEDPDADATAPDAVTEGEAP